jgi:hypothetical protein
VPEIPIHPQEGNCIYISYKEKYGSNRSRISAMKKTNKPNVILGYDMIKGKLTIQGAA